MLLAAIFVKQTLVQVPDLAQLQNLVDRLKNVGDTLTVSITQYGDLHLQVSTSLITVGSEFRRLRVLGVHGMRYYLFLEQYQWTKSPLIHLMTFWRSSAASPKISMNKIVYVVICCSWCSCWWSESECSNAHWHGYPKGRSSFGGLYLTSFITFFLSLPLIRSLQVFLCFLWLVGTWQQVSMKHLVKSLQCHLAKPDCAFYGEII